MLSAEVPSTASRRTDANLDCAFLQNALIFVVAKIVGTSPGPLYDSPGAWRALTDMSTVLVTPRSIGGLLPPAASSWLAMVVSS